MRIQKSSEQQNMVTCGSGRPSLSSKPVDMLKISVKERRGSALLSKAIKTITLSLKQTQVFV